MGKEEPITFLQQIQIKWCTHTLFFTYEHGLGGVLSILLVLHDSLQFREAVKEFVKMYFNQGKQQCNHKRLIYFVIEQ